MSTTDIAPDTIPTGTSTGAADLAGRRERGAISTLGTWLTSSDSKVIGRQFIGASILALLACAVLGVVLGAERIDGADTLVDAGALPQLFAAFRIGLVYGVLIPFLLGIAVAIVPLQVGARSLAFPRLAAAGFWAWFAGLVLLIIALANNGGPGGGDADMVDLFLAAHGLLLCGLAAAAVSVACHRADHEGPRHAHEPGAVLRLVGAGRLDRPAARPAGRARRARLPLRRPPQRPRAVRRQRRRRLVDRVRPHPTGDLPVRPAGRRDHRRADPGHVPQADADARHRLRRPGDHRRRRPLGGHRAGEPRRAVGRQRARPRRLRRQARRPPAVRPVHLAADPRRRHRDARRRRGGPPGQ